MVRYIIWPGGHGMVYVAAWRGMVCYVLAGMALHGIWYGLVGSMAWYMVWPGGHGMGKGMAWGAWHSIWYDLEGMSWFIKCLYEPAHDKTNKMTCAPSKDSDQPWHLPSLIRVFAVHLKKHWVISYPLSTQRMLWSEWVDAQADLSLRWTHRSFCWFCHAAAHIEKDGKSSQNYHQMSHLMTKPTKWHAHSAKTQISLGICPVWSESSLSAWRSTGLLAIHWAHSEGSDQTGPMPRLIWVFAGCIGHFAGFVMLWLINQQNGMCTQRSLRSAWTSTQSDQSIRCVLIG